MEYEVEVEGEGSVHSATDLKDWLTKERAIRWTKVEQHRSAPGEGELGPDLLPILTVALASPFLTELVKSVFAWLRATRSDKKITVKAGSTEIKFDAKDEAKVLDILNKLNK
jgi:hypothetical protein